MHRRCNVYHIHAGQKNFLVDTGMSSSYNELRKKIDSLQGSRSKIDMLMLTHSHYDHCRNAARIREEEKSPILMGKAEIEAAAHGYTTIPRGTNPFITFISWMGRQIGASQFGYTPFSADIGVEDAYQLPDENLNIRVIASPGHSIGSISILIDDYIALVGDAMFGINRRSIYPPFADNTSTMIKSWGKLLDTPCELFLPGHGRPIRREELQRDFEKYRKKLNIKTQ